jgi:hypothetical protein
MALGDAQERALHAVVSDAIDRAVQRVGGENNQFLKDVLTEHRDQLEAIRYLPTLAAAVQELVRSLEPPPGANPIAPPRLAEVLVEEIGRGILENTRRGGPLAPLVVEAGFIQLLGLSEQLDAVADLIRRRMSAPSPQPVPADDRRSLAFAYLDPAEDRTRILEEPFTGRDWMMQEIEQFIAGNDRGYIVIEADAGSGKTAFALWCSGRRDWPVHYSQYSSDARRTGSAVRNLAAQLIEEWDLTELAPDAALPANADWSSFLRQVLSSAAARRDAEPQTGDRRPIVLVVDGLDEAEDTAPSSLPWGLPDDMPQGVYIVATVRTGNLRHRPQCPLHWCAWRDRTTQQTTDMRMFLDEEVPLNFAVALVEAGADSDQFIATLMERSGHNWLYLHHVLAELTAGTRQVTDVPDLPRGLAAYYHNAVERLLGDEDEGGPREALLSTLAVLRRPVDRDALTRLAGTGRGSAGDRFLGRQLRPFCHVSESDRWQLGHVSFNEYLAAKSGAAGPAYLDEEQHRRLQRAARRAHRRISAYYLARFGGVETGLARLCADPGLAQCDDNYALEMLGHHLVAAGKTDNLHILLTRESDAGNAWYAAHEAGARIDGYLRDLELARRSARSGTSLNAKLIWYALIRASIASASSILPPRVLARMVRSSRFPLWTPARAFTHVEQMTDRTAAAKWSAL